MPLYCALARAILVRKLGESLLNRMIGVPVSTQRLRWSKSEVATGRFGVRSIPATDMAERLDVRLRADPKAEVRAVRSPRRRVRMDGGCAAARRGDPYLGFVEVTGAGMNHVVSIILTDLGPYAVFSRIRGEFFPKDPPTSTAVQVAGLLLNAKIEIDAIAFLPAGPAA